MMQIALQELREAEMSIIRTQTWSLTTLPLVVLHFDWPVETKAIGKLSKFNQKLSPVRAFHCNA